MKDTLLKSEHFLSLEFQLFSRHVVCRSHEHRLAGSICTLLVQLLQRELEHSPPWWPCRGGRRRRWRRRRPWRWPLCFGLGGSEWIGERTLAWTCWRAAAEWSRESSLASSTTCGSDHQAGPPSGLSDASKVGGCRGGAILPVGGPGRGEQGRSLSGNGFNCFFASCRSKKQKLDPFPELSKWKSVVF